uniref:SCP domain-containing protein n=1 Tax=Strongyloides papillosus TaxID=174720 RepID=A0A0N5C4W4_STREA
MKVYILLLTLINTLLSQEPPPLPLKRHSYVKAGNSPALYSKDHTHGNEVIPPQLPSKRFSYVIPNQNRVLRPQSIVNYSVKLYLARGMKFYECNRVTFSNQAQAEKYCAMLNKYELKKAEQNHRHHTSTIENRRKSLSRSNSDLTNRRNSISESSSFLRGSKNSFSGSKSSLSGISRSSLRQSLTESGNHLSPRRHSISGSNRDLSWERNSISGSTRDLSGRSFLSKSRESLNNNGIDNERNKQLHDKYTKQKPKSHQIWLRVWSSCSVECYSANYYDVYKQKVFTEINLYRQMHNALPIRISPKLSVIAQELADKYAMRQTLDVDKNSEYGILYEKSRIESAPTIIRDWYNTNEKYNFFLGKKNSKSARSFTQIVWATTTKFGIGVQHDSGYLYVVCVFSPKGNKKGEYKKNVHKWTN